MDKRPIELEEGWETMAVSPGPNDCQLIQHVFDPFIFLASKSSLECHALYVAVPLPIPFAVTCCLSSKYLPPAHPQSIALPAFSFSWLALLPFRIAFPA